LAAGLTLRRKRVRFEVETAEGDKISLVFEGSLNREKLYQLADFVELIGGPSDSSAEGRGSKLTRLMDLIERHFPFTYFSSREVSEAYRHEYREHIPLSTVSTYLARLAERGYLIRSGLGNMARYRIAQLESGLEKMQEP